MIHFLHNKRLLPVAAGCLVLTIGVAAFFMLRQTTTDTTATGTSPTGKSSQPASSAQTPAQQTPAKPDDKKSTPTQTTPKPNSSTPAQTSQPAASGGGTSSSGGTTTPTETPGLTNAGILATYTGSYTINSGTVVLENKQFTGRLTINGGNVTIRNSRFNFEDYYHVLVNGGTVTVEHSEFDGMNTTSTADDLGITGDNLTVRWSVFKRFVNAMRPGSNSLIEHNVISNPNTAYGPAHTDGIEVYGGSSIIIRNNSINISGGIGETGCVNIATDFASIDNVLVENNDFTGGTYSLYARLQGAGSSITNIKVRSNRWHTPHIFGTHSVAPLSAVSEWTNNTLDGQPLAF